ncbi:hypothetical protein NE237_025648 [Protea cynaroides]|uniref:DUF4283 domain-containing protein n=1 Tax=Protea cynaroides TaxID=273540 RepID=A0A9Q0H293_9MAGN|nr:hypothetical protein NE237_025648 [Protea cynaroides]
MEGHGLWLYLVNIAFLASVYVDYIKAIDVPGWFCGAVLISSDKLQHFATFQTWSSKFFYTFSEVECDVNLEYSPQLYLPEDKEVVGVCKDKEVSAYLAQLSKALIGFFIGKKPSFMFVKKTMERVWRVQGSLDMFQLLDGSFLLKFSNIKDHESIGEGDVSDCKQTLLC